MSSWCSTRSAAARALGLIAGPIALLSGCMGEPGLVRTEREVNALETQPWLLPDVVVAEVNGHPITRGDYYQRVLKKFGARTTLFGILKEELFLQEASRLGLTVSPEEVQAKVEKVMAREAEMAGGREALEAIYRQEGLSLEDLRRDYQGSIESDLIPGKVTKAMRRVDQAALREYYQRTYAKTQYRVRHIAYTYPLRGLPELEGARLKVIAREKAARSVRRIREGADFAQIARQESEDATRDAGGDIGYISEDTPLDPGMKEVVLKLKPLEVSDPVDNERLGAYHVVQVTEIVPHQSYSDCEEKMKAEIAKSEPTLEEIQGVLNVLRARASIKVFGADKSLGGLPLGAESAGTGAVEAGAAQAK